MIPETSTNAMRCATALVLVTAVALGLSACGFLSQNPRPDDPDAIAPSAPDAAAGWSSIEWHEATVDGHERLSREQTDRATSLAHGPGGYVAIGSNGNFMHYVGRIWWSADGQDWLAIEDPLLDGLELVDVAATDTSFVAIGTRSADVNDPDLVILRSADGRSWKEVERIGGAWAMTVAAGLAGYIVAAEVGEASDLLVSRDGSAWTRVRAGDIAPGDAYLSGLTATDSGWLAVGSSGGGALALRSADGRAWTADDLPASTPGDGIARVSAYAALSGRWGDLVLGLDESPSCIEDDDWCARWTAGWSNAGGAGWQRLPKKTRLLGGGWGGTAWPAGDAGFVAWDMDDMITSADGWDWSNVRRLGDADPSSVNDAVLVGDELVVVSEDWSDIESSDQVWIGVGTITR